MKEQFVARAKRPTEEIQASSVYADSTSQCSAIDYPKLKRMRFGGAAAMANEEQVEKRHEGEEQRGRMTSN